LRIDKKKILWRFIQDNNLHKILSAEEIRTYILLVIKADNKNGEGILTLEELNSQTGEKIIKEKLHEIAQKFKETGLVESIVCRRRTLKFKLPPR